MEAPNCQFKGLCARCEAEPGREDQSREKTGASGKGNEGRLGQEEGGFASQPLPGQSRGPGRTGLQREGKKTPKQASQEPKDIWGKARPAIITWAGLCWV
jgi:hypothetical protein